MDRAKAILESWNANAEKWVATIEGNEIESRRLVTNAAIVDVVKRFRPKSIVDIGCGEGWLTRQLQAEGIAAHGIDAIEALIATARTKGGDNYDTCTYEELVKKTDWPFLQDVDAAVINFALLDKDNTANVISYLPSALPAGSKIFIQTLHPYSVAATDPYQSGWKDGSWNGLKQDFTHAYQWYFRTLQDWVSLFVESRLSVLHIEEPIHPVSLKPASIIFVLEVQ